MKTSKIMVFRVLKWLALALGIIMVSLAGFSDVGTTEGKASGFTAATVFVLFAIFFHLEQHKS